MNREPGAVAPLSMAELTDDAVCWRLAIMHNLSLARARAAERNEPVLSHMAPFASIHHYDIIAESCIQFIATNPGFMNNWPENIVEYLVSNGVDQERAEKIVQDRLRKEAREKAEEKAEEKRREEEKAKEMERAARGQPWHLRFLNWYAAGGRGVLAVGFLVGGGLWLMVNWKRIFRR